MPSRHGSRIDGLVVGVVRAAQSEQQLMLLHNANTLREGRAEGIKRDLKRCVRRHIDHEAV